LHFSIVLYDDKGGLKKTLVSEIQDNSYAEKMFQQILLYTKLYEGQRLKIVQTLPHD